MFSKGTEREQAHEMSKLISLEQFQRAKNMSYHTLDLNNLRPFPEKSC